MDILNIFKTGGLYPAYPRQPYIIAEAGVNHEGDLDTAIKMIQEAKDGGADAIKFQVYKADMLACTRSPAYWDLNKEPTRSQHQLFSKYDRFGIHEYKLLKETCVKTGIEFMCTAFDPHSAEMINDFIEVIKIASADITNQPFIEYLCDSGKPIILSTGASDFTEIRRAVSWISAKGNPIALLHCKLLYPTPESKADLACILSLQDRFPSIPIGYSDHTVAHTSLKTLEIATLMGAVIIEKHFTLDKSLPGNDHYHSMDKNDLIRLRKILDDDLRIIGSGRITFNEDELPARIHARRSIVASQTIAAGQTIFMENVTFKRPAHGISPTDLSYVIGKTAAVEIPSDTVFEWSMLK